MLVFVDLVPGWPDEEVAAATLAGAVVNSRPVSGPVLTREPRRARPGDHVVLPDPSRAAEVSSLGAHAWVRAETPGQVRAAAEAGASIWLVGLEAGGRSSGFSTLILLRSVPSGVPFVVTGLGVRGMGAALRAGASGVVLSAETWSLEGAPIHAHQRDLLAGVSTGRDTAVIEKDGHHSRVLARGAAFQGLTTPPATFDGWWQNPALPIPAPQSVGRSFGSASLSELVHEIRETVAARADLPIQSVLDADPLGAGTPIVQGPMANIAEKTGLACAVAEAGGIPFAALGALRPAQAEEVLRDFAQDLSGHPWGVGIIGFEVMPFRDAHLDLAVAHNPSVITLAGATPSFAAAAQARGIPVWMHAPSARLVEQAVRAGIQGVILEGHECGGHVGQLTSVGLWEEGLAIAENHPDTTVILAGGIGDRASAVFAASMAAEFHRRGGRVLLQSGTAFLLTDEARSAGQVTPIYQELALAAEHTVLIGSTVNLPLRCLPSPWTEEARALEQRMLAEGLPLEARRRELELKNLGRTRIAAKAVVRKDRRGGVYPPISEQRQRSEGAFSVGQGAAITGDTQPVARLVQQMVQDPSPKRANPWGPVHAVAPASPPQLARTSRRPGAGGPIAIVSLGCVLPQAPDVDAFWRNLVHGVDAVTDIPQDRWSSARYWDPRAGFRGPTKSTTRLAAPVTSLAFDPGRFGIPPRALPTVDPAQRMALLAAEQAISLWQPKAVHRERAAVVLGNAMGGEFARKLAVRIQFRDVLAAALEDEHLAGLDAQAQRELSERVEARNSISR